MLVLKRIAPTGGYMAVCRLLSKKRLFLVYVTFAVRNVLFYGSSINIKPCVMCLSLSSERIQCRGWRGYRSTV